MLQNEMKDSLTLAVEARDIVKVSILLSKGLDPNLSKGKNDNNIIFQAIVQDEKIAILLIDHGIDISCRSTTGRTPIFHAAYWGKQDVVNKLLDCNSNVDVCDVDGVTTLMAACEDGNLAIVKQILERTTESINLQSKYGDTALHFATKEEHYDVCKLLLQNGASPDIENFRSEESGLTPLDVAYKDHSFKLYDLLKQYL